LCSSTHYNTDGQHFSKLSARAWTRKSGRLF
jgi:hypothetical protein